MKTKNSLIVLLISLLFFQFSCEENNNDRQYPTPPITVYKFKADKDYTGNVYVRIDTERKRIIAVPSYDDVKYTSEQIVDFYKGYYLGRGFNGIYTAFLDISIEEFQYVDDTITDAGFYGHLVEKNPFEEFYVDEEHFLGNDCPQCVEMDTIWPAYDTAKFHRLVDINELENQLKKKI